MTTAAEAKAVLSRWYDEMWSQKRFDLVPEIAGPRYTRHEANGTRQVTAEEYRDALAGNLSEAVVEDLRYRLIAEDDRVVAIGTWKIDGQQWDWVQAFRVEGGKLVETWLSGINFTGQWGPDVLH